MPRCFCPSTIGDYTDFYASIFHATNVGKPVPSGQSAAAELQAHSDRVSRARFFDRGERHAGSTACRRADPGAGSAFGPTRALDYELEVGFFIGAGNALGEPIPIESAEDHVFGVCLVNDWSARDIQAWEYQPLGPFLGKSFATTISPWVVPMEALAPYRAPLYARPEGDPAPLPYLDSAENRARGAIDLTLEVEITSAQMRASGMPPFRLSRGNFKELYWSIAQMVAHHTSNGCNLRPGDLLASGTVSGPDADSRGCLLEMTRRGADPITLPTGEVRKFLEDGDEDHAARLLRARGLPRIGLGECTGASIGLAGATGREACPTRTGRGGACRCRRSGPGCTPMRSIIER